MGHRRSFRSPTGDGVPAPKATPPFDPELSLALADLGEESREPLTPENLAARQRRDATARPRPTAEDLRADGRFEVAELRVPGPPGGPEVTLVSARPSGLVGPLPLLYYMHGGAMVMGNAWSVLPRILREWDLPLDMAVISVEYRLAPGAQYPEPLEDCYAGLVWATAHATELDIDPDRVIIGGKSAGWRPRRGPRPADPRPRWPGATGATAAVPHARRPRQYLLQSTDVGPRAVGPHLEHHRVAGPAG